MATIGITDSGRGGLTVLKALYDDNRNNNYIYLADTVNSPYGIKSKEEITKLTKNCCDKLIDMGSNIIVLACNTATSAAIDYLRPLYNIEIIGTEPAISPAIINKHKRILVLATPYTMNSSRYIKLSEGYEERLINCPCRDLASMIDEVSPNYNLLYDYMESILKPFKGVNAIILGCTHYVLIKDIIHKIIPNAVIYDSSYGIARRVSYILSQNKFSNSIQCSVKFLNTDIKSMDNYYQLFNNLIKV